MEDGNDRKTTGPSAITGLDRAELAAAFGEMGEAAYRADQVLEWLHGRRAASWESMTNLPKTLRQQLQEQFAKISKL